jgi:hypothetical protein
LQTKLATIDDLEVYVAQFFKAVQAAATAAAVYCRYPCMAVLLGWRILAVVARLAFCWRLLTLHATNQYAAQLLLLLLHAPTGAL